MSYKKISQEYFATILDRLSRFEPACIKYERVFDDIISKFATGIKPKELSLDEKINIAQEIFNSSTIKKDETYELNEILEELEDKYFIKNDISKKYLKTKINLKSALETIKITKDTPKNLSWFKKISESNENIYNLREKNNLLFPLEKIILCEGQTEYTLLKTILNLFEINLDQLGILVLPAGGKNQVARKYYNLIEYTKIPFFILLDCDAKSTMELINTKLRKEDEIYIIQQGEFEDLIPENIIKNTINYFHQNDYQCKLEDFDNTPMTQNIENIYRKYGFGEYKKALFAKQLKEFIETNATIKDFQESEFIKIAQKIKNT